MNTDRRRFNLSEKLALFDEADGLCVDCGDTLEPGWHADHARAYARGGATAVENGRALCPACNLKKGSKVIESNSEFELRDCQANCMSIAIERYKASHQIMAAYMSVGSGKTLTGAIIAAWLFKAGLIDRVIVVCPNSDIARGWSKTLSQQGMRVVLMEDGNLGIDRDLAPSEHGYIISYQSVARQEHQHRKKCLLKTRAGGKCRSLVILDELHHLGEDPLSGEDRTAWAEKAMYAFGDATHILQYGVNPDEAQLKRKKQVLLEVEKAKRSAA